MPGEAVNRLAAQQALLLALWEALDAEEWLREYELSQRLMDSGHSIAVGTLAHALRYLQGTGLVESRPGDRWRRREGK
jgi:DNA-binding PadR family transcriptional regulator